MTDTVFFKHKYIIQKTLTPEDMFIKALQYLKHVIKGTANHKGKTLEALVKMEELFNTYQLRYIPKKVLSENDPPKVLKCFSDPRVTLGVGAVTKGKKRQLLSIPSPSQPGYLTAIT